MNISLNLSDLIKEQTYNCQYITVNYDYSQFIFTNFILSLSLFFNRIILKKYSTGKGDNLNIDMILKIILVVYNTSFVLLQMLTVPLQNYFLSMGMVF